MVMQVGTPNNKDKGLQGGHYARTEGPYGGGALQEGPRAPREVQDRTGGSGQEIPELESAT
jgi:hypothetical protein